MISWMETKIIWEFLDITGKCRVAGWRGKDWEVRIPDRDRSEFKIW